MTNDALIALAERIEAAPLYDAPLTRQAFDLVETHLPDLDRAMIRNGALGGVDAVLTVIDHGFPGWSVSMHGTASETHGDWTCTLRRSEVHDNDMAVGVGKGPHLPNALLGALLKLLARTAAK